VNGRKTRIGCHGTATNYGPYRAIEQRSLDHRGGCTLDRFVRLSGPGSGFARGASKQRLRRVRRHLRLGARVVLPWCCRGLGTARSTGPATRGAPTAVDLARRSRGDAASDRVARSFLWLDARRPRHCRGHQLRGPNCGQPRLVAGRASSPGSGDRDQAVGHARFLDARRTRRARASTHARMAMGLRDGSCSGARRARARSSQHPQRSPADESAGDSSCRRYLDSWRSDWRAGRQLVARGACCSARPPQPACSFG